MTAEMASRLWRNRLRRRVSLLALAASLTLVGAALLSWQGVANASGTLKSGNEVTVWMKPDANAHEIHTVGTQLARLSYLRQPCAYWNKSRNFAEARKLLPSDVSRNLTVADMPTSYWCMPVVLANANRVIDAMKGMPGVEIVTVGPANL
jgi:cell division protein FtsX